MSEDSIIKVPLLYKASLLTPFKSTFAPAFIIATAPATLFLK
jgi:hypothetical protein